MRPMSHLTGTQIAETTKVAAGQAFRPGSAEAETRNRQEYYADLRVAVSKEESVTARRTAAEEQDAADKWSEKVTESRWMWSEYQRRWPPEDRSPVDRSDDDPEVDAQVDAACDQIADLEREKISPAMRAIESQDPDRRLIGFEHRLKGPRPHQREGLYTIEELGRTPEQAVFSCLTRSGTPFSTGRLTTLKESGQTSDV